ncbi:MAG: response regulator transcription factor [Alphaproteobacteria bacterium]|nr:response regulator transcription factor [Alphaproteobacteria bacterium]
MTMSDRIALIDDEALFRETLAWNLEDAGFSVDAYAEAEEALRRIDGGQAYHAILLDWQMPVMNGLEFLKVLRQKGHHVPVIFLTGLQEPIYEERGLAEGAIDYIEKTRSVSVILHRLRLAIGGAKVATAETPPAGLALDSTSARAEWRGRRVDLTLSEFRVVMLLAEREGKDVSYREIYNAVKGEGFIAGAGIEGYRANVRALVKRIRQKFKDVDPDFTALENYPGFGYRWRPESGA